MKTYLSGIHPFDSIHDAYAYKTRDSKPLREFELLNSLYRFGFTVPQVVAKQLSAEVDLLWLKYFENFIKGNLETNS